MREILKEMGVVCQNKKTAEIIQDFHRQKFNSIYLMNREQAERHKKDFMFWSEKILDMNKHLNQLHKKLKIGA
jgi:protein-tyrosine-phosphatase